MSRMALSSQAPLSRAANLFSRLVGWRGLLCLALVGAGSVSAGLKPAAAQALEAPQAALYFTELREACDRRDGGRLWGVEVCGPVMLVDPRSRAILANASDREGLLSPGEDGVLVGTLPSDQPLANAPIEWGGVRWAMVLTLFLSDDALSRVTLLAHESFHRIQPQLGLMVMGRENDHLDTLDGRYWLQLEWRALEAALGSPPDGREQAMADALSFRAARRRGLPDAAQRENAVELREGLAQYTGLRIAGRSAADVVEIGVSRRAREDSFVRGFGYSSGPLYGYLLDSLLGNQAPDWRSQLSAESDLGALLAAAADLEPESLHSRRPDFENSRLEERAALYGGPALRESEETRERERQRRLSAFRERLIEGPVLMLDLSLVRSATMDTREVHPLDENRIVFTRRSLIAEWGKLEVSDGGAILENRASRTGSVSLLGADEGSLSGPGWTLTPNDGWGVEPGEREGDRVLRRID